MPEITLQFKNVLLSGKIRLEWQLSKIYNLKKYLSIKTIFSISQHTSWRKCAEILRVLRYRITQQKSNYELISQHICYANSSATNCYLSTKYLSTSEPLSSISAKKNRSVPSQHKWTTGSYLSTSQLISINNTMRGYAHTQKEQNNFILF